MYKMPNKIPQDNHTQQRRSLRRTIAGAALSTCLVCSNALADDTEVFFGQVDPSLDIFPNVLFVLDTSGSMNWTDGGTETRLERMKDALDTILDNTSNVNVGMMRFNGYLGGGSVIFPITPIDEPVCEDTDCGLVSLTSKVSGTWGDAEEALSNDEVDGDDDTLNLGTSLHRGNEMVGLHFEDIAIPQGATITDARLAFTADSTSNQYTQLTIVGELSPTSDVFDDTDEALSSRPKTNTVADWVPETWYQGQIYSSSNIKDVLQEIVDQTDWCGGNSLSFYVSGTGNRNARSIDDSPTDAPSLRLTYDSQSIPATGGCVSKPAISQISQGSDDVSERVSNGWMTMNSRDLRIPRTSSRQQLVGLRFADLKIPKNALIKSASIEFEVDRTRTGTVSALIKGESHDSPPTYSSGRYSVSSRPTTASSVLWPDIPALNTNSKLTTADLSPIVQELVNRSGWQSGNAMAFQFSYGGGSAMRELESFNGEPSNAPKLKVVYEAKAGTDATFITARDKLKEIVNGLTATGGTPILSAYYEAARYMRGESVDYGRTRGYNWYRSRFHRVSTPSSYTGGTVSRYSSCTDNDIENPYCVYENIQGSPTYTSPLLSSCQSNHIVFLSDGEASTTSAKTKVKQLTGVDTCESNHWAEGCGEELAQWLYETDHSSSLVGKQNITTYTIGFNFSGTFLPKLAAKGGGTYNTASSAQDLVDVFQSILGDVLAVDTSFVAPGATVNQFNRLTHRNDIYFALFKPDQRPTWSGNLKRYEVGTDSTGKITIKDANGAKAVDETSGFFADDSRSWWSDSNDGNVVSNGGASAEMDYSSQNRRIFTYLGDNNSIPSSGVDLTTAANEINENNNMLTLATLGLQGLQGSNSEQQEYRDKLLKWARGIDVKDEDDDEDTTDWRLHMGDPMHSRPVILNYAAGSTPHTTVFVGTNEGYLHAIERDEGKELYSFIPQELLENLNVFYENQSSDKHPYGLDGSLSVWTDDANNNVIIDSGEEALLYSGMRRGGRNYYAMDVSNRLNPRLAWVIEGGQGDFAELGQTWSRAAPAQIYLNGQARDVLIFGAGYDTNQDPDPQGNFVAQTPDSVGRGIYIVDARTGQKLWSGLGVGGGDQLFPDMKYSIPSDLRIIDTDFDGYIDQMYVGDMGGQIWRFDLKAYHSSGPLMTGGVMAKLSGASPSDHRRFYYEPDVALIAQDGEQFLSISIGSGWRAHPLDIGVDDQFFMLKSYDVGGTAAGYGKTKDNGASYSPITVDDLVDITNTIEPDSNPYGWKLDMAETGEKILGDSITINNQIIFTSYKPALSVGACTTAIGGGSVYVVSVLDGSPVLDVDEDGDIDLNDREKDLAHGGIPPEPAALITENGPTVLVGPEQPISPDFSDLTVRTFWMDRSEDLSGDQVAGGD